MSVVVVGLCGSQGGENQRHSHRQLHHHNSNNTKTAILSTLFLLRLWLCLRLILLLWLLFWRGIVMNQTKTKFHVDWLATTAEPPATALGTRKEPPFPVGYGRLVHTPHGGRWFYCCRAGTNMKLGICSVHDLSRPKQQPQQQNQP